MRVSSTVADFHFPAVEAAFNLWYATEHFSLCPKPSGGFSGRLFRLFIHILRPPPSSSCCSSVSPPCLIPLSHKSSNEIVMCKWKTKLFFHPVAYMLAITGTYNNNKN